MNTTATIRKRRGKAAILKRPALPYTPEMERHATIARPGQLSTRYRLVPLYEQLALDKACEQAGATLQEDIEVGIHGGNGSELGGVRGSSGGCPTQHRLDAIRRARQAEQALGEQWAAAEAAAMCRTWAEAASRARCRPASVKARCADALKALALHYRLYGSGSRMRLERAA